MHNIRRDLMQPISEETRQHVSLAYSAGDTIFYLFTDATSHRVQHSHQFVYFCVMTNQNVDHSGRRNLLFSRAYSAQTINPSPKLTHKRHILGM